jgi:uncharacterized protein
MTDSAKGTVNWSMLCHLAGLTTYIGVPLGNILAPLIIWVMKRDTDSSVNENGKEALNFNISFTIYGILAGILCYVLIGFVLLPLFFLAHAGLVIWATLKANKGETVHYPLTLRFIN